MEMRLFLCVFDTVGARGCSGSSELCHSARDKADICIIQFNDIQQQRDEICKPYETFTVVEGSK